MDDSSGYEEFVRSLRSPLPNCLLPLNENRANVQGARRAVPRTAARGKALAQRNLLEDECFDRQRGGVLDSSLDGMLNSKYKHDENAKSYRKVMSGDQPCSSPCRNDGQANNLPRRTIRAARTPPANAQLLSRKSNIRSAGAESKNTSVCFTGSPSGGNRSTVNRSRSAASSRSRGQNGSNFGADCPDDYGGADNCLLDPFKGAVNPGMLEWLLNKFWAKQQEDAGPCPLNEQGLHKKSTARSGGRRGGSCFQSSKSNTNDGTPFQELDDLWNPEKYIRWKCVEKWDQYKESMWKQLIYAKLDCPSSYLRDIKKMMEDAFNALHSPGGECVAYRMIYGMLKRNEDMYLNEYLDLFTDEQFIQLIVALNRFFHQDRDKRKSFLDYPPPTFIEKIMMKETLGIIDSSAPFSDIARRFWELLLDWYSAKVTRQEEAAKQREKKQCVPSSAASSSRTSAVTGSSSASSVILGQCGIGGY